MIKDFTPMPYEGINPLPDYVTNIRAYTLVGTAPGGYRVTLAKLTVGESKSAGNPLARVSGFDREFIAVKNAMIETGVDFFPTLSSPCEEVLRSLGDWFMVSNPEITECSVVSQTCH